VLPETEAQREKERKRDGDKTTDVDYKDDEETSLDCRGKTRGPTEIWIYH